MIRKSYIPCRMNRKVNYLFILQLFDLAEYNQETNRFDTIKYASQQELAAALGLSLSGLRKYVSQDCYNDFFTLDAKKKTISLNCRIDNGLQNFIVLNDYEKEALKASNDKFLVIYYIFLKKMCQIASKNHKQNDCTAKQFLQAIGYSDSDYSLQKVSECNTKLQDMGLIKITKYRDRAGHCRNIFQIVSPS